MAVISIAAVIDDINRHPFDNHRVTVELSPDEDPEVFAEMLALLFFQSRRDDKSARRKAGRHE